MADDDWLTRADYHLQGWGEWRRGYYGGIGRGYDSHSAVIRTGGYSQEFDHLVGIEDAKAAAICDTVIRDLHPLYRTALESEYLLQGVIKHNRIATGELLRDAQWAFWQVARRFIV